VAASGLVVVAYDRSVAAYSSDGETAWFEDTYWNEPCAGAVYVRYSASTGLVWAKCDESSYGATWVFDAATGAAYDYRDGYTGYWDDVTIDEDSGDLLASRLLYR
jgi:hypothetical protein